MKKDFFTILKKLIKIQQTQIDYVGTATFFLKALNIDYLDFKAFLIKNSAIYKEHKKKSVIHIYDNENLKNAEYGIPIITIFY